MSTTLKISLLALVSSVAAVPHYDHSKFHKSVKATGASATGDVKPYPSGGWIGSFNSTRVSGTGSYNTDKTIDVTTTSTKTVYSTVVVKPSLVSSEKVVVEKVSSGVAGQCGPATVTVTASEKVTVTVTPGGGADVPKSSAVPAAESSAAPVSSAGNGYGGLPSSALVYPTPDAGKPSTTPIAYSSTKVEAVYSSKGQAPSSKAPAPSSKAEEYKVSSKAEEYKVSSKAEEYKVSSKAEEYKVSSAAATPVAVSSAVVSSAVVSSAAASTTPSSGNTYTGSKRGLAYNEAALCKTFGSKFGFGYNWGQVENNDIGAPFIPMMHGPTKATSQEWLANVDKAVKKGTNAVMGFNEPDHAEQANLTPDAACSAWKEYMNPIASSHPDVTIIGPSVTNGGAPMGLTWLSNFHDACPGAVIHATNIHFYDIYESATIDRFKAQVEKAAAIYGKPVWITEFGLNPGSATQEQAASFLTEAMAYLDASDKVQGYSWFMVGSGENQLNSGSGLSAVGKVYAGSY